MSSQETSGLTDDDVATRVSAAQQLSAEWLLLGIHTALFFIAVYLILIKGVLKSRSRLFLLLTTIVMFSDSMIGNTLDLTVEVAEIRHLGFNRPDFHRPLILRLAVVSSCVQRLNYILSDAIVVWRAWVFWPNNIAVHTTLCLCMLATIATTVADMARVGLSYYGKEEPVGAGPKSLLLTFSPFITNFLATVLIGFRVWLYRRDISSKLGPSRDKHVERILYLLVESGLLYCIFWLILLTVDLIDTEAAGDVTAMLGGISISLSSLYPTVIIIVVAMERSYVGSTYEWENGGPVSRLGSFLEVQARAGWRKPLR
ncbi:hypothetical protein C8J56DRAFT_888460 [Mycena floridula]|nr:hypothetical protein C8J56DRAFT_888460 [Mycena floridula]